MPIPVLSFFTGAGLLDIGMHDAGFDVIWRNEFHKPFIDGFQHGFSKLCGISKTDLDVCSDSITDLTPYSIRQRAFSGAVWPDSFGIIGGPPCPDFSVGGKNKGKDGDNGKLTGVYFDQIKGLLPTFFIFENVKGIISNHKNRSYLRDQVYKISTDYVFDIKILNALDLGAPQDRERVIVLGFHKSYIFDICGPSVLKHIEDENKRLLDMNLDRKAYSKHNWFDWPHSEKFNSAKSKYDWPTTTPFGFNTDKPNELPIELCVGNYLENLSCLENQDEFFTPNSDKFNSVDEGDVSRKSFKRLHRWRYSPTAAYGNNEVHLHPFLPRRLSVREAMKIQTIPDKYALPESMTLSNKYKTIGNGVPVVLAREISLKIRDVFQNEKIASLS